MFWVIWCGGGCMQILTLFLKKTWKFSNLILSYSFLSICSGISLFGTDYYLLATNTVHLKTDLHPSSPICHGLKICASFHSLGPVTYSQSWKQIYFTFAGFQISAEYKQESWTRLTSSLSNITFAIILLQKLFSLKTLRFICLNIQTLSIRVRQSKKY